MKTFNNKNKEGKWEKKIKQVRRPRTKFISPFEDTNQIHINFLASKWKEATNQTESTDTRPIPQSQISIYKEDFVKMCENMYQI